MDKVWPIIFDYRFFIAIAVIVLILFIFLLYQKVSSHRYLNKLEELEKRYNEIKSVPVQLKVSRASAITGFDAETADKVTKAKEDFTDVQDAIKKISSNLSSAEDFIHLGKFKKAAGMMSEIKDDLQHADKNIKSLDGNLDDILAKEIAQRQVINQLKNRFRALKSQAQENANKLSSVYPVIDRKVTDIENMFATFEEWMYSNDYDKAGNELAAIQSDMAELDQLLTELPSLIKDARGVVPSMAETLKNDYVRCRNRGVYLKHLNVESNLQTIKTGLMEDLSNLSAGRLHGVRENIDAYKTRIRQMDDAVKQEGAAYEQLHKLTRETDHLFRIANKNSDFIDAHFEDCASKYGLGQLKESIDHNKDELAKLNSLKPEIYEKVGNYQLPAVGVLDSLKELNQSITEVSARLSEVKEKIESASGEEERVRKQLTKLQIITSQMKIKIRKNKLPNISDAYHEDMEKSKDYIDRLSVSMKQIPLDIDEVNGLLQEALNFIYKLYNNVNNVVGAAVMTENTIVFGNRYRSTYEDIDSELTRSELAFRNGEYTKALTEAITTIEKIHPGNYETIIKENAHSAA